MVNETSPVKRARATRAEMRLRQDALAEIVREIQPCTVRQVFYQATVRGVVEKTEAGYVGDRGRDAGYPAPPAQIRTCPTKAYGSYLG